MQPARVGQETFGVDVLRQRRKTAPCKLDPPNRDLDPPARIIRDLNGNTVMMLPFAAAMRGEPARE